MKQPEITFETAPWEQVILDVASGGSLDGIRFLALMEPESEESLEDAFSMLEQRDILLSVEGLGDFSPSSGVALRLRTEKEWVAQGADISRLEEDDALRLYLEEIAALPACEEPQQLLQAYRAGQEDALVRLTNAMLAQVLQQAFHLAGRGVLLMDLLQEGSLGLWQGILSYESGDFESHCRRKIQQSLHRALLIQARQYGVGQKMRQAMEDYRAVDELLLGELGRTPTLEELAEKLHLTVEETAVVAQTVDLARRLSFTTAEPEPEEEELAETQAVEDTAYFQMRQRVSELLSELDEVDAKLLSLRFGLKEGLPMSAPQVGEKLGLTPDEVTTREAAALAKLRKYS
ncbi:MAG: sigma-70 family RNA polymerase sigma factor [Ruminococcaceae bacterium]|nr:sigma-70 family RNA polymerase sigma factor [Oscillospiraceae bacterium]